MKKQNTALYILRLTFTLLLICAAVAGALAGVNALTKDKIADIQAQKLQTAMEEVLPGASDMTEVSFADATGTVRKVYQASADSAVQGYVVEVAPNGFGGAITMMVGVADGKVTGISVVSHTETAGLGSVAADKTSKGQAFRDQFAGTFGEQKVDKDGGNIDAITGATITSRAVTNGVNAALAAVAGLE